MKKNNQRKYKKQFLSSAFMQKYYCPYNLITACVTLISRKCI